MATWCLTGRRTIGPASQRRPSSSGPARSPHGRQCLLATTNRIDSRLGKRLGTRSGHVLASEQPQVSLAGHWPKGGWWLRTNPRVGHCPDAYSSGRDFAAPGHCGLACAHGRGCSPALARAAVPAPRRCHPGSSGSQPRSPRPARRTGSSTMSDRRRRCGNATRKLAKQNRRLSACLCFSQVSRLSAMCHSLRGTAWTHRAAPEPALTGRGSGGRPRAPRTTARRDSPLQPPMTAGASRTGPLSSGSP